MLGNPSWSAFYLWKAGAPVPENVARFPKTMAALEDAPLCRIPGRTPSILFSLLRPGAHIAPHHGFMNARYICHLPLIVPEGCAMRVGGETRAWDEGRACVFDDSIEHEAWNRNPDKLRVVMIFDIWRPELSAEERELVGSVLQAVDSFGGGGRVTLPDA
ncbi:aspartyl/asparaginyl beta-hydroxylase domain-containing protein [Phenylobacterium sp. J367]|nr:aspartyl/asparaginyl beta-hydroxylase domain-containing protein [Phenylobacterium sp. J367]